MVIFCYWDDEMIYSDTGYIFRLSNGIIGATQVMDKDATIDLDEKDNVLQLRIQGNSGRVDDSLPLVKWIVPFKLFCRSVLRWDNIGYWFNSRLKQMRVKKQYPLPVSIVRDMQISQEEIDRVIKTFRKRVKACIKADGKRFEYNLKKQKR